MSRVISLEFTLATWEKGFNQNLINNTVKILRTDVERMVASFANDESQQDVVENYEESSSWLRFYIATIRSQLEWQLANSTAHEKRLLC
ncbi:MAG: hypothetical protein U5J63_07555 [Fodinibius sp.]|nr:hypothetical protein [Fodinibius sp.]